MPNSLDLNLMVIARQAGMDLVDLPGLYVADLPRSVARGRESDRLVLYLVPSGPLIDHSEQPEKSLTSLSNLFYKTPGSVTAALRSVAEAVNQSLYLRNLANPSSAPRLTMLAVLVLRGEQIFLAQSGPMKSLVLTANSTQVFYDPDLNSLGSSETPSIRYFQATLQPNDTLLLTARPPDNWDADSLGISHGQGPEGVRRRLLSQTDQDVSAVLIQARPGKGSIQQLRSIPVIASTAEHPPALAINEPIPAETVIAGSILVTPEQQAAPSIPASAQAAHAEPAPGIAVEPTAARLPARRTFTGCLLAPFLWIGGLLSRVLGAMARLLQLLLSRLLPEETLASISNSTMALIALAVPVAIVAISSFIYFQRGDAMQTQIVLQEAAQAAQHASAETDPNARRQAWEQVLTSLNQSGAPADNPEAAALRIQAQAEIDAFNLTRRANYQPAIVGGLPANVKIIRMLIQSGDLYLLDGNSGTVLRASLMAQGYVVDPSFACQPSTPSEIGPFVDILPGFVYETGKPQPEIVALDAAGNLMLCWPDQLPSYLTLPAPSARTFTQLKAFSQDFNRLYVLDPPANAVWVYPTKFVNQAPQLYFDEFIPPMQNAIDLATAIEELYLLHSDGHMSVCQTSNLDVSPTRCTDPAPYIDSRPGMEDQQLVPAAPYSQVRYSQPPDPALYLLEPTGQAIDLYSLQRLTFQRRYLPAAPLAGGAATAFAIDPLDRTLFLAAGNNIYYARIP